MCNGDGDSDGDTPSSSGPRSLRAYRIAYDGTDYYGFQRQPSVPTVEGAIFAALRSLEVFDPERESTDTDANRPDGYAAAGRTDSGVSAVAQTIAFEAPDWLTPRALNSDLPADVRAWAVADAPPEFHATHHATRREYTYQLYAPPLEAEGLEDDGDDTGHEGDGESDTTDAFDLECPAPPVPPTDAARVDDDRVRAACRALSGDHDYHNLSADDDPNRTERSLTITVSRDGDYLVCRVESDGFARQLVRRLVALVREIGTGESPLEKLDRVLADDPLPGPAGVGPAPPEPLVLTDVTYGDHDLEFRVDPAAAESARNVFGARSVERKTGSRVASQLAAGVSASGSEAPLGVDSRSEPDDRE
ncbi:tRNA pseudouridine(38-40) synthase TruA [Halobiforma nitratireducens]|uniref:tRNA pseudouridine synthase A n=1 Tax=Halobiforma nitratireducens JCM 10879 TaxID=1227454 RepID=M0LHX0_9EURY|nr:tRNA pseudouridine(38-40) synthase TruA [Halobiforma nitratireducens]EMA33227.1 tRNA pseudouridine synthase A [Halobiforma nitratireducens JCM 10879]